MILLDTNVVSALMRARPDPVIVAWLDRQSPEAVWTTSITIFEIEFGLALLPDGRRRNGLIEIFQLVLRDDLGGRVALFDYAAASAAARLAARRRQAGRMVDFRDTQIAGIALARRATMVTGNIAHFHGLDTPVLDPWQV